MTALPSTRSTIWHESAHTSALCVQGLVPLYVRTDEPSSRHLGLVKLNWETNDPSPAILRKVMIGILAGALQDDMITEHAWPIDADSWGDHCHGDAEKCAFLAELLGFRQIDWIDTIQRTLALTRQRPFRELQVAVGRELELREIVFHDELVELTNAVIGSLMATPAAVLSILLEANASTATRELARYHEQLQTVNEYTGAVERSTGRMNTSISSVKRPAESATKSVGGLAKSVGGLAKAFLAIGAAYAGIESAKNAIETTLTLAESTERLTAATSLDTKTASTWIETAKARGISATSVTRGFIGLDKAIRGATEGSKTSKKAFDELGVSHKLLASGDTAKIMDTIAQGLKNTKDPAQRAALAQTLFGRATQGLLPIFKDGKKGVDDALAATQKYGDYLKNDGTKSFKTALEAQRGLSQAGAGLKISFTEAVLPTLEKAAGVVLNFVQQMRSGKGAGGEFAQAMKTAFAYVKLAVGAVADAITFLVSKWPQIKATAEPIITWLIKAWQDAVKWLTTAFDTVAPRVAAVFNSILRLVTPVITTIINGFKSLGPTIGPLLNAIAGYISTAFQVIKAVITPVAKVVIPVIADAFRTAWADIKVIVGAIVGVIKGAFQAMKGAIEVFTGLFSLDFSKMWQGIRDIFSGAVKQVLAILNGAWGLFKNAGKFLITGLSDGITAAWNVLKSVFSGLPGDLVDIIKGVWNAMYDAGKFIIGGLQSGLEAAFNGVMSVLVGFLNDVIDIIDKIPGVHIGHVTAPHLGGSGGGGSAASNLQKAGFAAGGMVTQPGYFAGEEAPRHPEVILATNPAYRSRNLGLFAQAGHLLGVPGFAAGGVATTGSARGLATAGSARGLAVVAGLPKAPSLPKWISGLPGYLLHKAAKFIESQVGGLFSATAAGGGAILPGNVTNWLMQAMSATGVTGTGWLSMLERQVSRESGGNPNAINTTDINAQRGDPSRGLLQTIGSTFQQYALPGHGNIYNPVDNSIAAIRYMIATYGGGNPDRALAVMTARGGGAYRKGGIHGRIPHFKTGGLYGIPAGNIFGGSGGRKLVLPTSTATSPVNQIIGLPALPHVGGATPTTIAGAQDLAGTISGLRQRVSGLTSDYSTLTTYFGLNPPALTDADGNLVPSAVNQRLAELNRLLAIRQQIFELWGKIVVYTQRLVEANRTIITGLQTKLAGIKTKGLKGKALTTAQALQTSTRASITKYQGNLTSALNNLTSDTGSRTSSWLDVLDTRSQRAAVLATTGTAAAASVADTGIPTDTGAVDNSAQLALLQTLLTQSQQTTAVAEAQYGVLKQWQATMPPFGGSFASGGVVPGPVGSPRTIIAHGGESVGQTPIVEVHIHDGAINKSAIEVIARQSTRTDARLASRHLPGSR